MFVRSDRTDVYNVLSTIASDHMYVSMYNLYCCIALCFVLLSCITFVS